MPIGDDRLHARAAWRWSCRNSRRRSRCGGRARSKAASGTIRMSGSTSGASAFGSRMPQTPASSGCPERLGAHDQRLAAARRPPAARAGAGVCELAHQRQRIDLGLDRREAGHDQRRARSAPETAAPRSPRRRPARSAGRQRVAPRATRRLRSSALQLVDRQAVGHRTAAEVSMSPDGR